MDSNYQCLYLDDFQVLGRNVLTVINRGTKSGLKAPSTTAHLPRSSAKHFVRCLASLSVYFLEMQ
jgi:hypothetical protein